MRFHRAAIVGFLAFAVPALAQSSSGQRTNVGAIRGRVFDSVAAKPIANAEVHAIGADAARPAVAFSDSAGRFLLTDLPAGQYALIFYHEALEDLALARRAIAATVSNDTVVTELATPSANSVLEATCGPRSVRDSTRLIIGRVVDVESDEPRRGARVDASWIETMIERGLVSRPQSLTAMADVQGRFGICGIPRGIVTVRAASDGQSSGTLDIDTQESPVIRLRIALATRGLARVSGVVRDSAGQPLANVRVAVVGAARGATSDQQGRFDLDSVPAGSQLVEWKAIGYTPSRRVFVLRPREANPVELRLDERIVALDAVHVREAAEKSGFAARRAQGIGYFLTAEQIAQLRPNYFADVARRVPGLRTLLAPVGTVLRWRDGCAPTVYLNGLRMTSGAAAMTGAFLPAMSTVPNAGLEEDVDFLVDPRTITGIEVYPPHAAPALYPGGSCATVLIWAGFLPK